MNLLVWLVREHPEVVDRVAASELVSLAELVAAAGEFLPLDRGVLDAIAADDPLGPLIAEGYLRGMPDAEWRERMASAVIREPFEMSEWVTFAAGKGGRGISLPDDDLSSLRVSVFTRVDGKVRRASIELRNVKELWGLSISPGEECSRPDWGACDPAECGGNCSHDRDPEGTKMICWCAGQTTPGHADELLRW